MTEEGARSLGRGELEPLADLIEQLGLTEHFSGDAVMHGSDPISRSPHRLGEASCTAQLLIGIAGAAIWEAHGGTGTDISMDIIHALHYLHQTHCTITRLRAAGPAVLRRSSPAPASPGPAMSATARTVGKRMIHETAAGPLRRCHS